MSNFGGGVTVWQRKGCVHSKKFIGNFWTSESDVSSFEFHASLAINPHYSHFIGKDIKGKGKEVAINWESDPDGIASKSRFSALWGMFGANLTNGFGLANPWTPFQGSPSPPGLGKCAAGTRSCLADYHNPLAKWVPGTDAVASLVGIPFHGVGKPRPC